MSLARHWRGLSARFDRLALRAPAAAADEAALLHRHASTAQQLHDWCHVGAGPGHRPAWQPGARTVVARRLAVAALRGPDATALVAWCDAFARDLDGGTRLDALDGRGAALLRLRCKLREAMWWRQRERGDPWDAGWAVDTPPALRQLKAGFAPRRATLILADAAAAGLLRPALATLVQRADNFDHPVRWLWVGGASDLPEQNGIAVTRLLLAAGVAA
jgi:hypothetical protein